MDKIEKAARILQNGGIVIFPTDTAFGMGCRVDDANAVKRLFAIRKRSKDKPVPVLVDSIAMAQKYWHSPLPTIVRQLAEKYWPGALTIIYTAKIDATPPLVRGGGMKIGLRMPDHEIPLELMKKIGVGIIGTSANFAKHATPYTYEDLDPDLVRQVDMVLPGVCTKSMVSTVVDCTAGTPVIIRQGATKISI